MQSYIHHMDLIRNAPAPDPYDTSDEAQVIRIAQNPASQHINYTWADHYATLWYSIQKCQINHLNGKLHQGLEPSPLIRNLRPEQVDQVYHKHLTFAKSDLQQRINWMWNSAHIDILNKLDLKRVHLSLQDLDAIIKMTGAWNAGSFNTLSEALQHGPWDRNKPMHTTQWVMYNHPIVQNNVLSTPAVNNPLASAPLMHIDEIKHARHTEDPYMVAQNNGLAPIVDDMSGGTMLLAAGSADNQQEMRQNRHRSSLRSEAIIKEAFRKEYIISGLEDADMSYLDKLRCIPASARWPPYDTRYVEIPEDRQSDQLNIVLRGDAQEGLEGPLLRDQPVPLKEDSSMYARCVRFAQSHRQRRVHWCATSRDVDLIEQRTNPYGIELLRSMPGENGDGNWAKAVRFAKEDEQVHLDWIAADIPYIVKILEHRLGQNSEAFF